MNRRISIALCLFALCFAFSNLVAKNVISRTKVEIVQIPAGPVNDNLSRKLDDDLDRLIKSHNSDLGAANSKYDGVNRNRECIDLKGYGNINKKTRDYLHDSLHKMIREHNRRIEQAKNNEKNKEKQAPPPQVQQQQMMMQQQQMMQQQIINQQQQMYQQQMQRRQEEQEKMRRQQEEARRLQEENLAKQKKEQERLQKEQEREQKRVPRRDRGSQRS